MVASSLSEEAIIKYNELQGKKVWFIGEGWRIQPFLKEPPEEFLGCLSGNPLVSENKEFCEWYSENHFYYYNISRHDPFLVQTVEDLGSERASGSCARLLVTTVYGSYRIDEYDGAERVMTPEDYDWL